MTEKLKQMKRSIQLFLFLLLLNSPFILNGQSSKFLEIGAGINFTSAHPSTLSTYHTNFAAGLTLNQLFTEHLNLRYGLFYQEKGYSEILSTISSNPTAPPEAIRTTSILKLRYLILPVELEYLIQIPGNEQLQVGLSTGVFMGYALEKEWKIKFEDETDKVVSRQSVGDELHNFDYGISTGLSFHFQLFEKVRLSARLRYDWGLKNIEQNIAFSELLFLKTRSAPLALNWVYEL